MTNTNDAARDETLLRIAQRDLMIETLATRNSDALDFHDLPAAALSAALAAAYEAGREAERKRKTPTRCDCPACGRRIDIIPIT